MKNTLINKIRQSFKTEFNSDPLMVFSPGRINLIGEHIDYNDGFVFPAAIDKGIVLAIQETSGSCLAVATDFEEAFEFNLDVLDAIPNGGWRNYLIGVIKEIQKKGKVLEPFNVMFGGNVPSGAGLSSSAALENAIVFGLNELFQLQLTKKEMIFISQKAEHNYVGVKCGIMDQFASMFGKEDHFILLDCKTLQDKSYSIELNDYELLLINSNVQHNLSDSTYNERRALCERASDFFGKDSLRDLSRKELFDGKNNFTDEEYNIILYVIEEIERTHYAAEAIEKGNIKRLGELLFETHNGLSEKYKVSCRELDFLVDFAKDTSYIIGARMMGGGFGGCTINLIEKKQMTEFVHSISKYYLERFGYNCTPISIKLSQGTHLI